MSSDLDRAATGRGVVLWRSVLVALIGLASLAGPSSTAARATAAATTTTAATPRATPVLGKTIIGYSVQHRPIVAYHLGDPAARPASLIIGQIHGDEHAGVVVANSIIHGSRSVEGINLWVIPTMNPDGDHAHTRQNAHKVDLNRNWPNNWRHLTGMYYSGTKPLSEPESRAVSVFLKKLHPHYLVVLHQPLDGVDTTTAGGADGAALVDALAHNLHLAKKSFTCWSVCYGSLAGWYDKHKLGIPETVEFGWHPSHSYLVGTVRRGIVAALHGHFGSLARHNPRYTVGISKAPGRVTFSGWAYDIDKRSAHLYYQVSEGGTVLATHRATGIAHSGHGIRMTLAATPGWHHYCTTVRNVGAGTTDPRTCIAAWVPKASS